MKVRITVQSESGEPILRSLLPNDIQAISKIVPVGDRDSIISVAATLRSKYKEPVAVLIDTKTVDPTASWETCQMVQETIELTTGLTPLKVIPCNPALEAIFFESPDMLERLFPKVDPSFYRMFYLKQSKESFDWLFQHGGGPKNLEHLLRKLTDDDIERLRATGPIRELITFAHEVADLVAM